MAQPTEPCRCVLPMRSGLCSAGSADASSSAGAAPEPYRIAATALSAQPASTQSTQVTHLTETLSYFTSHCRAWLKHLKLMHGDAQRAAIAQRQSRIDFPVLDVEGMVHMQSACVTASAKPATPESAQSTQPPASQPTPGEVRWAKLHTAECHSNARRVLLIGNDWRKNCMLVQRISCYALRLDTPFCEKPHPATKSKEWQGRRRRLT